jgi:choline/ethanolamine kinase
MAIKTNGFVKDCLPEELKKVLRSVAASWGDVIDDMGTLRVIRLSGAMTNEVYQINWPTKHGQGPRLLGRFPDGRVEEFIHARVCEFVMLNYYDYMFFVNFGAY